ncbi:alpha/beta hydrolase [Anaerosporobacter faecicola]|uniref:alpha/beta hydrolase n=1 Tax=Anaerosporobacter faecicola TaxID=2718714 RepID=UPI00143AF007|nr:alpha/beta hydrolase [Anaerosporobacter faecicola]
MRRRKLFYGVLLFLGLLLVVGMVWQRIMVQTEIEKYSPVGDFVDVGGYQAHYVTKGTGDTTFVFITGSGTPCAYTDFYLLQNELAHSGQTITFDHAGSGWSGKAKTERSIGNLVKELSILIDTVAPEKPVVFLCHSLGSLEAIAYAQQYPKQVKGIIFLDSGSPEFYHTDSERKAKLMNRGFAFLRSTGLNRFMGNCGLLLPLYGENVRNGLLSGPIKKLDQVMYYRFAGNKDSLQTINKMNENAGEILEGPSLGNLPILVLSSDSGKAWEKVQRQLATWSSNSKQVTIEQGQHYIYWSNYEDVLQYIKEFLEEEL